MSSLPLVTQIEREAAADFLSETAIEQMTDSEKLLDETARSQEAHFRKQSATAHRVFAEMNQPIGRAPSISEQRRIRFYTDCADLHQAIADAINAGKLHILAEAVRDWRAENGFDV